MAAPGAVDTAEAPVALDLDGLTWRPATRRLPTIDDLTLHIAPGERVLLAGASGSGKSTVLTALAGLLDTTGGDLTGTATAPARPGERGLLLQNPVHALVGETVGRDAAFGPENIGAERAEIQRRVTEALRGAAVDLDARARCLDASGGQQQRIALAGALALSPGALLLDEPTSMLDAAAAEHVRGAVLAAVHGRTLVVAEHGVGPWLDHVDRLVVLGPQAKVLADGPPAELLATRREVLLEAGLRLPSGEGDHLQRVPEGPAVAGAGSDDVLALHGVAVTSRGAGGRRRAPRPALLTDVDLHLRPGQLLAVTGPSGSGKTSLLRVVLGVDRPQGGTIAAPSAGRTAWVPQDPEHSFVATTVREEVSASPRATDPERAQALLVAAGLDHLAGASPYALSGGEQRRLAVVAALAEDPALLVLDEPTVGLDAHRFDALLSLLDAARAQGCAVLAATHDPELAARADGILDLEAHSVTGPRPGGADRAGARRGAADRAGACAAGVDRAGADPARADGAGADRYGAADAATPPDTTIGRARLPHRAPADLLNPLTACLIAACAAIGSFAVGTWQVGLVAIVPTLLLVPLATRTVRGTLLRSSPVLLSAAGLLWSTALLSSAPSLSPEAWLLGVKEALRILAFVLPGVLVLGCMDPTALGDALGGRLRLPGRVVAASVGGLVRVGHIGRQWDVIMTARRLRGLGAVRSWRHPVRTLTSTVVVLFSATFALLVDVLRAASWQALAMDARGFARAEHRTWALPSPFGRADLLGLLVALVLLVLPWAARMALGS